MSPIKIVKKAGKTDPTFVYPLYLNIQKPAPGVVRRQSILL